MATPNRAGTGLNNRSGTGFPKSDLDRLDGSKPINSRFNNRMLAALPKSDLDRCSGQLKPINFEQHYSLSQAGEDSLFTYFLEDGIASVVSELKGGSTVEVGLVGREGLVNVSGVMGTQHAIPLFHSGCRPWVPDQNRNRSPAFPALRHLSHKDAQPVTRATGANRTNRGLQSPA